MMDTTSDRSAFMPIIEVCRGSQAEMTWGTGVYFSIHGGYSAVTNVGLLPMPFRRPSPRPLPPPLRLKVADFPHVKRPYLIGLEHLIRITFLVEAYYGLAATYMYLFFATSPSSERALTWILVSSISLLAVDFYHQNPKKKKKARKRHGYYEDSP
jgi:hypothetical protein